MKRGLGRCVIACKDDPEKYRHEVLSACKGILAYDPQCEGTRADQVYSLIGCFEDKRPFIDTAADAFIRCNADDSWKISYLAELLMLFKKEGSRSAGAAIAEKYGLMYEALRQKKRVSTPCFHLRDSFDFLCSTLVNNDGFLTRAAADIGTLMQTSSLIDEKDFDNFYLAVKKNDRLDILYEAAKDSADIKFFLCAKERSKEMRTDTKTDKSSDEYKEIWAARQELGKAQLALVQAHKRLREAERMLDPTMRFILRDYREEDTERLEMIVKTTKIEKNEDWHSLHTDILAMPERRMTPPVTVLRRIYETTLCSCCREKALKLIAQQGALTKDILDECRFDSRREIREFARDSLQ